MTGYTSRNGYLLYSVMYGVRDRNLPYTHSEFRMLAVEIHMSLKCFRYLGFVAPVPDDQAEGAVSAR